MTIMYFVPEIFFYLVFFIGLYFQVFLLVSFFFTSEDEDLTVKQPIHGYEPSVAIIVPCWNEEKTVKKTVDSLLALEYPRQKLSIIVVNDGSTDSTWDVVQQYVNNPCVKLLTKQNEGSKFAALNFGIEYIHTNVHAEIIGCLDADSTVDANALYASIRAFAADNAVMAVMPAMTIIDPQSVWQYMQKVEYEMMTFGKQVFHNLQSIFVAPGPFALFKDQVFLELGGYREAYHTEDLEICLRMIQSGMQIAFAHDSRVYTHGPKTFKALIKQRVRWIYGFLKNMQDFKSMLFTRKYGNISVFILPVSVVGMWSFIVLVPFFLAQLGIKLYDTYEKLIITGIHAPTFSWFYFNTQPGMIMVLLSMVMLFVIIMMGRSILGHKKYITVDLITFLLYSYASMYWTIKAIINTLRSQKSTWR
jgi:cellulose synthase/poly-beta-1,6-N-acetylglucosamine synthase-like glycosyltransferase